MALVLLLLGVGCSGVYYNHTGLYNLPKVALFNNTPCSVRVSVISNAPARVLDLGAALVPTEMRSGYGREYIAGGLIARKGKRPDALANPMFVMRAQSSIQLDFEQHYHDVEADFQFSSAGTRCVGAGTGYARFNVHHGRYRAYDQRRVEIRDIRPR